MTDRNPFANWPHIDAPSGDGAPAPLPLPGASPHRQEDFEDFKEQRMASNGNNGISNFLGGSPGAVFLRLAFLSLVVGALLKWLDLHPRDILRGLRNFVESIYEMGFDAVRVAFEYFVVGAMIVVPIWFVLRLMNSGAGRR
jgi:hypothetical protein